MAALRLEQLEAHLARELKPLYVIHGDEPLLALEAADAIRARARANGFSERVVLAAERGFHWGELRASGASRSLFGDKKLIELRLASGKPGADGAEAIEALCAKLPPDALTVVTLPRLDKAGQTSPWFRALERQGTVVNVYPVERGRLPEWIAARLARHKQRASAETLQFLTDCVEGNLLAAHQEIQKLALLLPAGELEFDAVREAVMNVARACAAKARRLRGSCGSSPKKSAPSAACKAVSPRAGRLPTFCARRACGAMRARRWWAAPRRSCRARPCSPRSSTPPKSIASSRGSSKAMHGMSCCSSGCDSRVD